MHLNTTHTNNTIPKYPVYGYITFTRVSNGNTPPASAIAAIKNAIIFVLNLSFLNNTFENVSATVQNIGAAVENIPHNNIIENIIWKSL